MVSAQETISVIVPVYNVENYLDACLRSIIGQTYESLEIIVVDDGSTDRSSVLCDNWAQMDPRIKVIHKENGGLSDARNTGMALATGSYISFIDSDDLISPEMFERLVKAMKRDHSDIAACSVQYIREDGTAGGMFVRTCDRVLNREDAQRALMEETFLKQPVWNKIYNHDCIRNLFFEVGRYHEDVYWSYQAVGRADRVSVTDYIGYYYRQRIDSIMGRGYSLSRLDALYAYCKRYDYMKERFPELADEALCRIWRRCIYEGQQALLYLPKRKREEAYGILRSIRRSYPIRFRNCKSESSSNQYWIMLSRLSLRETCRIRNYLKIGF